MPDIQEIVDIAFNGQRYVRKLGDRPRFHNSQKEKKIRKGIGTGEMNSAEEMVSTSFWGSAKGGGRK